MTKLEGGHQVMTGGQPGAPQHVVTNKGIDGTSPLRVTQTARLAPIEVPAKGDHGLRLFIAAPVRLYREGLAEVFGRDPRFEVRGTAATSAETLAMVHDGQFDLLLVDADLPGADALVREVARRPCARKVVVLGVEEIKDKILPFVEAGIAGYVTREGSIADLITSVESAVRGESVASPRMVANFMERVAVLSRERESSQAPGNLTRRERQIAGLIEEGLSNRDIALRLKISLPTVKNHVHNILEKLQVHRRGEAVAKLRTASTPSIGRRS